MDEYFVQHAHCANVRVFGSSWRFLLTFIDLLHLESTSDKVGRYTWGVERGLKYHSPSSPSQSGTGEIRQV